VYKATEEVIGPLSLGDLVFGLQVGFGRGVLMKGFEVGVLELL
jgi:hypothetical protein